MYGGIFGAGHKGVSGSGVWPSNFFQFLHAVPATKFCHGGTTQRVCFWPWLRLPSPPVCVFIGVIIAIVLCKKADVTIWTFIFHSIVFSYVCSTSVFVVSPFCASSI